MKVYLIYGKDGYGGQIVDYVYSQKYLAVEHIIKYIFGDNNYYKGMSKAKIHDEAEKHIETEDLLTELC